MIDTGRVLCGWWTFQIVHRNSVGRRSQYGIGVEPLVNRLVDEAVYRGCKVVPKKMEDEEWCWFIVRSRDAAFYLSKSVVTKVVVIVVQREQRNCPKHWMVV